MFPPLPSLSCRKRDLAPINSAESCAALCRYGKQMLETRSFKATALQFHGVLGLFERAETLPHKFGPHIYAFPWLRTFTQAATARLLVTSEPLECFFL